MKAKASVALGVMLMSWLGTMAQVPNDSLARQLMHSYLLTHPGPYQRVDGLLADWLSDSVRLDSQAQVSLAFMTPTASYQALPDQRYLRQIELPFTIEDSLLRSGTLPFTDTLSARQLRRVLRLTPVAYQGEDPRRWGRWGRSVTLVGGSLLLTVLLFTLRGG
jgi:hypothetical protein